jgi:NAD(P)-dependent dehydrogenase (short-subunit alcohol dehydrogenase family)
MTHGRRLEGKVAIVTGGGTGIGEAICRKFAREGAKVVVSGLPTDPIADVAAAIGADGGEAVAFPGDVAEEYEARACVDAAVSRFGRLDVLVNNAGVFLAVGEADAYPVDKFDQTLRDNCRSAFLMTKYALPHLRRTKGNIVCAGSEAGFNGVAMNAPYSGTKGFIHAFAKGVAMEQAKYGVRCNCVCPGPIDTAWTRRETGPMDKEMEQTMVQATALGRRGTPEEMANVYAFLASDEASYVTGALWLADGGQTPAHGPIGAQAERSVRQPPEGELDLRHAHDGLKNKDTVSVK